MGKMTVKNLLGADIEVESTCGICGKQFKYRLKERKLCGSDACYNESNKRKEKHFAR